MTRVHRGQSRRQAKTTVPARRALTVGVLTVGVVTAGFATAAGAQASVGGKVWNHVADCESGRHWHINTGNGYYGGLQFSSSTWAGYGGHRYGSQANRATRAEQIAIARRVLAGQGPGAWPVCGPRAGLTRHSGHASATAMPHRSHHRHATKHAHRHHAHHHHHARTHHRHHRHLHGTRYVVRSGDTLSSIAARFHVRGGWRALWHYNRARVHNPNLIRVGQVLRIP
jgi:nucleoid-associated protein YgaU